MPAIVVGSGGKHEFPGGLTLQVVWCSIIAAFGGFMFGYDIGISGGVTSMDDFLKKFFHKVYVRKHHAHENNYCKYNDQKLQLFTSSLYLAAIVASFLGSLSGKRLGRRLTLQFASVFFVAGAFLSSFAENVAMLIGGRLLLGAGVGLGNQTVPLFISEIAPVKYRGMLNIMFQLLITIGILTANVVNYQFSKIPEIGWRYSLGGAAVPAVVLLIGSLFIVETPSSLLQWGKKEKALKTLQKIRGNKIDVNREFEELCRAAELAAQNKHSYRNLFKRRSIPQLTCGTIIQIFQQFTGINVIMFYAPVLFQTMGFGSNASLLSAVITGGINVVTTFVANFLVDRVGRKTLLLEGALQMIIAQSIVGHLLLKYLKISNQMPDHQAMYVVVCICIFVAGFAWSWGPLGWLIPSEIYPLESRNAGFFLAVSMNMLCTFIIAQLFLTMLCTMRAQIFFFFAIWLAVMFVYTVLLMPETKGVHVDEIVERVWKKHWFWKRFYPHPENEDEEKKTTTVNTTPLESSPIVENSEICEEAKEKPS